MKNKKSLIYYLFLALKKNKGFKYFVVFTIFTIFLRIISQNWYELFPGAESLFDISISIILSILASIFFYIIFVFRNEEIKNELFQQFFGYAIAELEKIRTIYHNYQENSFFTKENLISSDGSSGVCKTEKKYLYNIENFEHLDNHIKEFEFFFEKALSISFTESNLLKKCLEIYESDFRYELKNRIIALQVEKKQIVEYYASIFEIQSKRPFISKTDYLKFETYNTLYSKAKDDGFLTTGIEIDSEFLENLYSGFFEKVDTIKTLIIN